VDAVGTGYFHIHYDELSAHAPRRQMVNRLSAIIICCFMKIRIPRTKREIELHAAMRKSKRRHRQQKGKQDLGMT
jgi:hypothetical protein